MKHSNQARFLAILAAMICLGFLLASCAKTVESQEPMGLTAQEAQSLKAEMNDKLNRAEAAATRATAAADRAEKAAVAAERAAQSAQQSADKAEAAANKAEAVFMQKMKK